MFADNITIESGAVPLWDERERYFIWKGRIYSRAILERIHDTTRCLLIYLKNYCRLSGEVRQDSSHMISGISNSMARLLIMEMSGQVVTDAFSASIALQNFLREKRDHDRLRAMEHLKAIRHTLNLDEAFGRVESID